MWINSNRNPETHYTALHHAAWKGHKDIVLVLLRHNANPLLRNLEVFVDKLQSIGTRERLHLTRLEWLVMKILLFSYKRLRKALLWIRWLQSHASSAASLEQSILMSKQRIQKKEMRINKNNVCICLWILFSRVLLTRCSSYKPFKIKNQHKNIQFVHNSF